jgi:hypothetical protein
MLQKNTTIILGAGASYDFGFPLGVSLRNDIVNSLRGLENPELERIETIHIRKFIEEGYGQAGFREASTLASVLPLYDSIDECLFAQLWDYPQRVIIGKFAIACCLAYRERKSPVRHLFKAGWEDYSYKLHDATWVGRLRALLFQGMPSPDLIVALRSLLIINFNYDRSIYPLILSGYNQLLVGGAAGRNPPRFGGNELPVYHPYGSLGNLHDNKGEHVLWGVPDNEFKKSAEQINVYPEGAVGSRSLPNSILKKIADSEKIIFLGFAFHEPNMKLLDINDRRHAMGSKQGNQIFATMMGVPPKKRIAAKELIQRSLGFDDTNNEYYFGDTNTDCKAFLDEYDDLIAS